jgi:hypothetical protein
MLRTRGQQRATVKEGGWAELPDELVEKVLAKVLELLQAGGLSFLSGLRHGAAGVRCMEGRARCDGEAAGAEMADHRRAMGMLVRRFPAVVSLEVKWTATGNVLSDESMRAVSNLPALTSLDITDCGNCRGDRRGGESRE